VALVFHQHTHTGPFHSWLHVFSYLQYGRCDSIYFFPVLTKTYHNNVGYTCYSIYRNTPTKPSRKAIRYIHYNRTPNGYANNLCVAFLFSDPEVGVQIWKDSWPIPSSTVSSRRPQQVCSFYCLNMFRAPICPSSGVQLVNIFRFLSCGAGHLEIFQGNLWDGTSIQFCALCILNTIYRLLSCDFFNRVLCRCWLCHFQVSGSFQHVLVPSYMNLDPVVEFQSLQYSLFVTCSIPALIFLLMIAVCIIWDRRQSQRVVQGRR
jgi:hypothetical protein